MPIAKVLIFSRRAPEENALSRMVVDEGYQVEWTDSGPVAICEALGGRLGAIVIVVGRPAEREVEYIPCLNRVDPKLPVIVISEHDSLELQRRVRRYRVFYYLPEPLEREELRAVLRNAVRTPSRRRKPS